MTTIFEKALAGSMGKYKVIEPKGAGSKLTDDEEEIAKRVDEMLEYRTQVFWKGKVKASIDMKPKQVKLEFVLEEDFCWEILGNDEGPGYRPRRRQRPPEKVKMSRTSGDKQRSAERDATLLMRDTLNDYIEDAAKLSGFYVFGFKANVSYTAGEEESKDSPGSDPALWDLDMTVTLGWK